MNKWIDCDGYSANIGDIGYLVETLNTNNGTTTCSLRDRPLRTNQSLQPRLTGWCGETNNRSNHAKGAWKILRVNKAQDRIQIVRLEGADLAAFLERDGYPELIPAELLPTG